MLNPLGDNDQFQQAEERGFNPYEATGATVPDTIPDWMTEQYGTED